VVGLSSDGSEEAAVTQPSPNPPTLTIEEHGEHLVPVKIDGEMQVMRLKDVVRGVAHQATASKAMTELDLVQKDMAKYERFFSELQANPVSIIRSLQERFGVTTSNGQEGMAMDDYGEPSEAMASLTAQITELKNAYDSEKELRARETEMARVNREIDDLANEFGDRFDRQAVLAHAVDKNIQDVREAFYSWAFRQSLGEQPNHQGSDAAARAEVLDAIAPGTHTATPAPPEPAQTPPVTPMDAVRRALESLPQESADMYRQALG